MSDEDNTHRLTPFETLVLTRFDQIDGRLGAMDARLEALENRAYDTKPIWEQALAQILEVKGELLEVKGGLLEVKGELLEVKTRLQGVEDRLQQVEDKLGILNEDTLAMRGHQRRMEKRVVYLEESKP
jgi:chromosome segregation ATPase